MPHKMHREREVAKRDLSRAMDIVPTHARLTQKPLDARQLATPRVNSVATARSLLNETGTPMTKKTALGRPFLVQ